MSRILLCVIVAIVTLGAIAFFTLRQRATASPAAIAALLPENTTLLIHIPDTDKNAEDWHRTDIYQLSREPTVQQFLQQPNTMLSAHSILIDAWHDFLLLGARNTFLATNSFDTLRVLGGLQFRCSAKEAHATIERWKKLWLTHDPNATRSGKEYGKYQVDIISTPQLTIGSVVVGDRLFAATNLDDLYALLGRNDGRAVSGRLDGDAAFRSAMKQMPAEYALMCYLRPNQVAQKLTSLPAASGTQRQRLLERVQNFSYALTFDGKNIRDVGFLAMPRSGDRRLTRNTLAFASAETIVYFAAIFNIEQQIRWILASGISGATTQSLQSFGKALSAAGISAEDCERAFGNEISLKLDWASNQRIPRAVATVEVRDAAGAKKVIDTLAVAAGWEPSNRDAISLYTAPRSMLSLGLAPAVAVSGQVLAFGSEVGSVTSAASGRTPSKPLTAATSFRDAVKRVPEPQQSFVYLDLPTLYSRLDSTLRPLLQMSAALLPGMREQFDPTKLPAAGIVSKHLDTVVGSQSYVDAGYRTESVGPITIGQTVALSLAGYAASVWRQTHQAGSVRPSLVPTASPAPPATPVLPLPTP